MNSGFGGAWFATTPEWWASLQAASGPIRGWKIWYADGSTADSSTFAWADAPATGVEVVMVYHDGGYRNIVRGRDEYTLPGESATKLGLEIPVERYREILDIAMADEWRI